jgi:predicted TIM-barrel enzyme
MPIVLRSIVAFGMAAVGFPMVVKWECLVTYLLLVLADIIVQHSNQVIEARVRAAVTSTLHRFPALWAHILPAGWLRHIRRLQLATSVQEGSGLHGDRCISCREQNRDVT